MPRLFIAIELPDVIRPQLAALRDTTLAARWAPPEQLHLTLRFIGDLDESRVEELTEKLSNLHYAAFGLAFGSLGAFSRPERARVLIVHTAAPEALIRLQQGVEACLQVFGLPAEHKPFRPHVTIARSRGETIPDAAAFIRRSSNVQLPSFRVDAFHLFESKLLPGGAEHRIRASFALGEDGTGVAITENKGST